MDHGPVEVRQRYRHRHRLGAQSLTHRRQRPPEIRARPIQLVDEKQRRQLKPGALPPDGLGLRLYPAHPIQHDHAAVQHPHRALDFDGEIHVTRRVDQLNPVLAPGQLGHGGGDGDAVFLLLGQVIHMRRAFVDLADFVGGTSVIQHPLGQSGLAGIHVGGDADVAHARQFRSLGHGHSRW